MWYHTTSLALRARRRDVLLLSDSLLAFIFSPLSPSFHSLCFHLSSLARSLRLLSVFQPLIYLRSTFHRNSPSQNILRISYRTKIRRATDGRSLLSYFGHESLSDIIWWLNGCTHRRRIPSSQSASACVDPSIWKLTPCLVGVLKPFHCEISDMCISSWQKVSSS